MFQTKVIEKIETHFVFNNFFRKLHCSWENVEKCGRAGQATGDNIKRRMRFECCIPRSTNTHSEYVIFIAFSLQQWLHERALMLPYTYIACPVPYNCNECLSQLQGSREFACIPRDKHTWRRLRPHFWQHAEQRHFQQKYKQMLSPRRYALSNVSKQNSSKFIGGVSSSFQNFIPARSPGCQCNP